MTEQRTDAARLSGGPASPRGLRLALLSVALWAAIAAGAVSAQEEAGQGAEPGPAYVQAPMLEAFAGLPDVGQRLPLQPLVMADAPGMIPEGLSSLEPGAHGGQLWLQQPEAAEFDALTFMLSENFLDSPGLGLEGLYPNLAESIQIHPNNTHFRLTLRPGLRWSDGTAVTTGDIRFTFEEIWRHELLNFMGMPLPLHAGGEARGSAARLEILDDYTFVLSFDQSYGSFLSVLGGTGRYSYADILKPAHYLKGFHPDYITAERAKELLQERGLRYEWELFGAADCLPRTARQTKCLDYPALWAWTPRRDASGGLYLQRNPYYHKVDAAGRQLPYIDRINVSRSGPVSGDGAFSWPPHDLRLLDHAPQAGSPGGPDADIGLGVSQLQGHESAVTLFLNLTHADENWRAAIASPDFRKALLLGVNQDRLAELLAPGRPSHFTPSPHGYAPEQAMALLDGLGLTRDDVNEWRRSGDGELFNLPVEHDAQASGFAAVAAQVATDLRTIGLKAEARGVDPLVLQARARANQLRGSLGASGHPLWASELKMDYLPTDVWGRQWRLWQDTSAAKGEEPPEAVRRLFDLHAQRVRLRSGSAETAAIMREIIGIHQALQPGLELVGPPAPAMNYARRLRNLSKEGLAGTVLKNSEMWFWGEETE